MHMKIHSVGVIDQLRGAPVAGAVLTGDRGQVRRLGGLFGESVAVVEAGEFERMLDSRLAFDNATGALVGAVSVLRESLRSLVECGCRASGSSTHVDADTPPLPHSLSEGSRAEVAETLIAIREAERVLHRAGIGTRDDRQPAWLDQVIDGEIEV